MAQREYLMGVIAVDIVQIHILFDARTFRKWLRVLDQLKPRAQLWILNEMQRECANDYVNILRQNISQQVHMSRYAPYSERYRDWKEQYFGALAYWRLKDDLLNNLTYWETQGGWMGGIPGGIMDQGGKSMFYPPDHPKQADVSPPKQIAFYARMNEYGWGPNKKQTERPIFRPTAENYATSTQRKSRGRTALRRTVAQWRR